MGIGRSSADLDRLLDRLVAGEEPEATGDLAPLLHPARVARATLVRSMDPHLAREHLATLRADRARTVVLRPRRGLRAAAVGLAAAVLLMFGGGSAIAASSGALPGDPLYGVKRAVERISLAMHRDPVGRVALHLRFADNRLHEIAAIVLAGGDPEGIVDDLQEELDGAEVDALHAVALGQDSDALLAHVQEMIAKHISVLNTVLGKVPEQARDAIQRAIDNAQNAQDKVQHGRANGNNKDKNKPRGSTGRGRPSTPPNNGNGPGHN